MEPQFKPVTYPIHERFHTFQGEGIHMGKPAFFIRTFGCPVQCPWCFGEGVKVHSSRGRIDVSEVRVGDLLWSFNEQTQKQEWSEVLGVESREVDSYFDLRWRQKKNHSIRAKVTGEHPFWVVGRGWVEVKDLIPLTDKWKGSGKYTRRPDGDVFLEIDSKSYIKAFRTIKGIPEHTRKLNSVRMRIDNPVHHPGVAEKVRQTLKENIRSGKSPNVLKEMWKKDEFRKKVTGRMLDKSTNPNCNPAFHAKSCLRPMGMISSVEKFLVDLIVQNNLPFVHNKGQFFIGGRVPDFVCKEKKKVIEVTSPDFQDRQKSGYHEKNRLHYAKHGYDCLTVYVPRKTIEVEGEVLKRVVEFTHNGLELIAKEEVQGPLKVYSIRTSNHTFFVEGVLTHNCDSAGTWSPDYIPKEIKRVSSTALADEAAASGAKIVVVTGGEPAIHNLTALAGALHALGLKVHLETSGAFEIRGFFDWITLSPKRWKMPVVANVKRADEFKFIIEKPEDIDFYWKFIWAAGRKDGTPVWLHPEWSQRDNKEVLQAISESVKKGDRPFRAGWQLHKLYRVDSLDARSAPLVPLGGNPEKGF